MMRISKKAALPLLLSAALLSVSTTGCKVRQTQEGKMPDVDVKVKGGQAPKYDVDTAKVSVSTEKRDVNVPKVNVSTEKREVEVPKVNVKPPK